MEMIKEIFVNKWFFTFVVGWVVLLFTIDWKEFYINVWGGVFACFLELLHDIELSSLNLYRINDAGIWIFKQSAFFTFGITFTMGVIFLQYLPRNPILQLLHVLVFCFGFILFEYIVTEFGLLDHIKWNYKGSLSDNVLVMSSMAWLRSFLHTKIFKDERGI